MKLSPVPEQRSERSLHGEEARRAAGPLSRPWLSPPPHTPALSAHGQKACAGHHTCPHVHMRALSPRASIKSHSNTGRRLRRTVHSQAGLPGQCLRLEVSASLALSLPSECDPSLPPGAVQVIRIIHRKS